jgi:hypothetical protein
LIVGVGKDRAMKDSNPQLTIVLGLIGAAIGGTVGYFAFFWFASQGFYALILPPGLMGLAAGFCARGRSTVLALICGIAGLMLALFTEWKFAPFAADDSLAWFMTHLYQLKPVTLLMVGLGAVFSFRLAQGFDQRDVNKSRS